MGGQQAILSLTLILGPPIAGLAFDRVGVPAPYWTGALLAALALLAATVASSPDTGETTMRTTTHDVPATREEGEKLP